jgi:hypothetical protein
MTPKLFVGFPYHSSKSQDVCDRLGVSILALSLALQHRQVLRQVAAISLQLTAYGLDLADMASVPSPEGGNTCNI